MKCREQKRGRGERRRTSKKERKRVERLRETGKRAE